VPSPNHPPSSFVSEPLLLRLKAGQSNFDDVIFAGQTTTTPDGTSEYTVSLPHLAPQEQMTHWLTVNADTVVNLEQCR